MNLDFDLERELRAAMNQFTADVQAPPDLLDRMPVSEGARPPRFPKLRVGLAALSVAAVVVAILLLAQQLPGLRSVGPTSPPQKPLSTYHGRTDFGPANDRASRQLRTAIDNWGATRGDRATDRALLHEVATEWAHPTSHPVELGAFEPVPSPTEAMRVLWLGNTPQGPAAFAVQPTHSGEYWYGLLLPTGQGRLQLAQRGPLEAGIDIGENDPHLISFTTTPAHLAVVAIPYDATDSVRMSFGFTNKPNDQWAPRWADVPVHDGAAIATVPAGGSADAGVVELRRGATVVADHRVDFVGTARLNETAPQPHNALGLWCNGCRAFGNTGTGWQESTLLAWVTRHAPAYVPVGVSEWSVGGRFDDGSSVLAWQMWVPGEPAHTVVLQTLRDGTTFEVLQDKVTDPNQRPLVQVRLPNHEGWLVASGPGTVITGWRTPGGAWHTVASKKSLLLPDAPHVELRLSRT